MNDRKEVQFWNPVMRMSSNDAQRGIRFHQRKELFDDKRSFVSDLIQLNPELGGLDGRARFGTAILYNPEFDELVGSAPGTAWGQGCIFTSEKHIGDRNQ